MSIKEVLSECQIIVPSPHIDMAISYFEELSTNANNRRATERLIASIDNYILSRRNFLTATHKFALQQLKAVMLQRSMHERNVVERCSRKCLRWVKSDASQNPRQFFFVLTMKKMKCDSWVN